MDICMERHFFTFVICVCYYGFETRLLCFAILLQLELYVTSSVNFWGRIEKQIKNNL